MNLFLKPAVVDGAPVLIRDPLSRLPLAAEGEWKHAYPFWLRRIAQGDVIDATPPAAGKPAKPEKTRK